MTDALGRLIGVSFSPRGLRITIPLAIAGMLAAGALFAAVEDRPLDDGLWWAVTTATTVGYGDVTPATSAGRLIGVALMFGGIGFLLVLAGAVVEHFVAAEVERVEEDEREVVQRLEALSAQVDELTRRLDGR